jgi:hypothetical protein
MTYEEVMQRLEAKAKEKDCERWLSSTLAQIKAEPPVPSDA